MASSSIAMSIPMPISTSTPMPSSPGMSSMSGSMSMGGGMDMGGGGDMDMGSCKSSMTWNWFTTGACFLSPTWYISSHGMFAGSCIGVICLVMALEFLRRVQREYNRSINRTKDDDGDTTTLIAGSTSNSSIDDHGCRKGPDVNIAATRSPRGQGSQIPRQQMNRMTLLRRQFIRAVMHMLQFGVAYIIMLIAMSFNGYIIISILIGAFLGSFIFSWDNMLYSARNEAADVTGCCG